MMQGHEKSDPFVVAMKPANEGGQPPEELVERRGGAEGNTVEHGMRRTPGRESMSHGLDRVRQAARERKQERFTALLHHIDVELLRSAYGWLRKEASAGVDGVTWQAYGEGLSKLWTCTSVSTGVPTGRNRHDGCISRSRTGDAAAGDRRAGGQDRPARMLKC